MISITIALLVTSGNTVTPWNALVWQVNTVQKSLHSQTCVNSQMNHISLKKIGLAYIQRSVSHTPVHQEHRPSAWPEIPKNDALV